MLGSHYIYDKQKKNPQKKTPIDQGIPDLLQTALYLHLALFNDKSRQGTDWNKVFYRLYCRWRSQYQAGRTRISCIGVFLKFSCACPKPGSGFSASYVVSLPLLMFTELR